jgi:citrate lyase subunit beta/citryl-CoA lyase
MVTNKLKRRSLLFCPAINEKFCKKAINCNADSIIFDLEDSVDNSAKTKAREILLKYFPRNNRSKELIIRINNINTPFYKEDLKLIKELKPDTICYPKTEFPGEIEFLESFIKSYEEKITEIIPLIETITGFFNAEKILKSSNRITATALGIEDLISELGIERGKLWENPIINQVLINLIMLSNLRKIQHIGPISRGYKTKKQLKELYEECKYLKKMNVKGKLAIHPNQLPIINKEFNITLKEIKKTKDKIKLFEKVKKSGSTVISTCYEMEDTPSLLKSNRFLEYSIKHGFI